MRNNNKSKHLKFFKNNMSYELIGTIHINDMKNDNNEKKIKKPKNVHKFPQKP